MTNPSSTHPSADPNKHTSWRHIWHLSWPIMISNMSQPLVGATDTAMMGHLTDPALIGGVALGTLVIHFIVMMFGFLRMSTTALTAQGRGAKDLAQIRRPLQRGMLIGLIAGVSFIVLSPVLISVSATLLPASDAVEQYMADYIAIHIFALPAILMNAALLGWLYGMQSMRLGMYQLLLVNGLNIALNLLFVMGFEWGITGVAMASVFANWLGFLFVILMIKRPFKAELRHILSLANAMRSEGWSHYISLSRDIMIRTILLYGVEANLLYVSGDKGDIPLASLQIILVIFGLIAFSLDGFAHASEALVGEAIGARQRSYLRVIIWRTTIMAGGMSVFISLILLFAQMPLLSILTSYEDVISYSRQLWLYVLFIPPASFLAFQMDGIFIGAAHGKALRDAMIYSFSLFVLCLWGLNALSETDVPILSQILSPSQSGLDGLLLAFILYLLARGIFLAIRLPQIFALTNDEKNP